ncbi:MAG: methyltransferase domain-containing protein [Candidatus Omnitrophica bacterium]|nr:methyltransferase domain-containing protein [Candidatus Omnitrophota bacterium]
MLNIMRVIYRKVASAVKSLEERRHHKIGDIVRWLTNPNTRLYWDRVFIRKAYPHGECRYENIEDFLPADGDFSLLDIGCALGDGCQLLKRRFPHAEISGADFSPVCIKEAGKKPMGIRYFLLDIIHDVPPRSFDFIILSHILEHMNDPYAIIEKCLPYAKKAILISTPYTKDFKNARLYAIGEHRYLFNEHSFDRYNAEVLRITPLIEATGYQNIIYRIDPQDIQAKCR